MDDSTIEQIIRAGMAAPSAQNQQPWEFYVVTNRGKKEEFQLSRCMNPAGQAESEGEI